jgi:hypothetical protein
MCEPRRLITLWASTACYRDIFIFSFTILLSGSRNKQKIIQDLQSYKYYNSYSRTSFEVRGIIFIVLSGVRLSPLGTTATTGLLYQHQMIDDSDCGAAVGIKFGRGNLSTR